MSDPEKTKEPMMPEAAVTKLREMLDTAKAQAEAAISAAEKNHAKQQRRSELLHFTATALTGLADMNGTPKKIAERAIQIGLATVEEFEKAVNAVEELT